MLTRVVGSARTARRTVTGIPPAAPTPAASRPSAPSPAVDTTWAALLAAAGGLAGMFAFPRPGIWPLAFVSVAALSVAVSGRRSRSGAWLGMLYGVGFFVPLLHWTGVYVGPAPWLILALAEGAFMAGLGAVLPRVQALPLSPLWIACAWVAQEAVRDRAPFGGFPWGRLAFSQASAPLRWFAALGGAPLVTFAVALGGGALASAVVTALRRPLSWRRAGAMGLAGAIAVPLAGAALSWPFDPGSDTAHRTATIALVQGSVPEVGLDFETRAHEVLDNHIAQTKVLAQEISSGAVARPAVVLWPENASDVDPFDDAAARQEIQSAVDDIGIPILVGAILDGPGKDHRRNAGILWFPSSGPGAQYIKRHPVPFGEYIPLRSVAKLVSSDVNLVDRDMVGGHGNGVLSGAPFPIGDVICFEVAYDGLVRSSVDHGAQLLVVQTNNATFGRTAETYQQLAMSRLRAVETGRTVAQVATTGKSAVIGPDGGIRQESGALFRPDVLVATVPLRTVLTPATRLGALPEYVLAALAAAALAWAIRTARRRVTPVTDEEEMVASS